MSIVHKTEAEPVRVLGDSLRILLPSDRSSHCMTAMTCEVPSGSGVPPHSHQVEEEGYFMLEGELIFMLGSEEHHLRPGDFAYVAPQVLHGYRNAGPHTVRFVAWTVGGPIDHFFREMSEQVHAMPQDAPTMMALMARYGIEMPPGAG